MPVTGVGGQVFEPMDVNLESSDVGGALYAVGVGAKRWRAQWSLAQALSMAGSDEWRAFVTSLNGSARTFLGHEFGREFPLLYGAGFTGLTRAGGGAFDGSLTSWSQTIGGDGQALATLNGLPAGFALSRGDYLDFRWTTSSVPRRHLVRALEAATANGSGVIAGVSVDPPILSRIVPSDAVGHLDNPACVMRLMTSQTTVSAMDRRKVAGGSIVAIQDLRP